MLSQYVQPSIVSLFSSTGTDPLSLFVTNTDPSLPTDSFVQLLHDRLSRPLPPPPKNLISPISLREDEEGSGHSGYSLNQTVLHIQSPTLPTTYIQCPPESVASARWPGGLGIKHPWMHIQVRNLGREWSFEVGLVDQSDQVGVLRLSTFQKHPRLKLDQNKDGAPPLLHLPLIFPSRSSHPLTPWSTISLHLPSFLPHFSSVHLMKLADGENHMDNEDHADWNTRHSANTGIISSGIYSHVAYVRVYATCRLRRLWFEKNGPTQKVPWEFQMYSDE